MIRLLGGFDAPCCSLLHACNKFWMAPPANYQAASTLMQSRLCVQAPLQGLLFASNASALLRSCRGSVSDMLQVGGVACGAEALH